MKKIAVSGKGGVGKTTLSAMLSTALALKGQHVIAIDADPDANLASAFGLSADSQPVFLAEMTDLITERTGAKNAYGGYFKLNPKVDDIPDEYSRKIGNVRILAIGGVKGGGAGCICPASALVKALLTHVTLSSQDTVIMDMDAGVEHLGRATAQSMDALLVVVDGGPWSILTAKRVRTLANDIGIRRLAAVVNRVTDRTDIEAVEESLEGIPVIGTVPYDDRVVGGILVDADRKELKPADFFSDLLPNIDSLLENMESL